MTSPNQLLKGRGLSIASAFLLSALAVACGPSPTTSSAGDSANSLTAAELASLLDFHAWKLTIPQSQQPLKRVKLLLVRADGTSVDLFGTAYTDRAPAWTNVLLGFRYESGRFSGKLAGRGPNLSETYSLDFTNASTEHPRSWSEGCVWNGARAELATFWNSEEAAKRGGNDYSTLVVELVK